MGDPECLSTERVFDGKVFEVDRDRVRMPNGREVTVDVIRHPPSAVIVPVDVVAFTTVTPSGNASVTTTCSAVSGPRLLACS